MKKLFLASVIIVLGSLVALGVFWNKMNDSKNEIPISEPDPIYPVLIVNGITIESNEHICIVNRGGTYLASLPLVTILDNLGFPVEWIDQDTATIWIDNQEYRLSLKEKALYKADRMTNCLAKGKGLAGIFLLRVYDDQSELYFDNYAMVTTLEQLGVLIDINWDMENNVIIVSKGAARGNLTYYRGAGAE